MADPTDPENVGWPADDDPREGGAIVARRGRGRRRFTPWRLAFTFCKLGAAIVVLAVIAAGVLTVRLQQGPIQIDGLGDKIASALQQRFGKGVHFVLGNAFLVQRGFGPTLAIDTLSVSGPDGQSILTAPKAEVSIDPFALVIGKVVRAPP